MVGVGGEDIQVLCRGPERNDAVGPLSDAHEQVADQEPPAGPEEELLTVVVVLLVLQVVEARPADRTQQQGEHIQDRTGGRDTDSQQEAGAFLQQLLLLHVVVLLPRQKDQALLRQARVLLEVPVLHLPALQVALAETVEGDLPVPFHQGRCWQLRYPPKQPH